MTAKISDYGCGPRCKLGTALDEDDLDIAANRVPTGDLDLVRCVALNILVMPRYDTSTGDWDTAATTDNQLFDVQIDLRAQLGQYSGASDEEEDFGEHGEGYYNFAETDIPLSHFSVDASSWTTEQLITKVLLRALEYLDTSGIQGDDPDDSPTSVSGTYEEDTPSP